MSYHFFFRYHRGLEWCITCVFLNVSFKTCESVIATQRAFCIHFMLRWPDAVLVRKSIQLGIENFRATGLALKRKPPWKTSNLRLMENFRNRLQQRRANRDHYFEDFIFKSKWIKFVVLCLNNGEINFL